MFHLSEVKKPLQLIILPLFAVLMQIPSQADPVSVASTVAQDGGNRLYTFAVLNSSSSDPYAKLIDFSISLSSGSILGSATAPSPYGAFTDPSSTYAEFTAADASGFALDQWVGGFQFLSQTQFSSFSYTADYLDSTEMRGTSFTGTTSPVASSAVPEPQMAPVLLGASLLLLSRFWRFRTKNARLSAEHPKHSVPVDPRLHTTV